jgi:uncharacterized protein involved in exopolysaccharide biosynthesis
MSIADVVRLITSLIRYLFSKWYVIGAVAVVFGLFGIYYAWSKKPVYIAELAFVTEGDSKGGMGAYAGIAAQFGLDIGGNGASAFEGENLIEVLRSRYLIERTLLTPIDDQSKKLLIDYYLELNDGKKNWSEDPKLKNVKFVEKKVINDRVTDSILKSVYADVAKSSLKIEKPEKKLEKIVLTMTSGDEFFAKRFAELLMENALDFYVDIKSKKSRENLSILQKQTDSVRSSLYGNISQAAAITDLNVNPARQIVRTGSQRSQMNAQANAALYTELVKNLELAKITTRKETPLVQVIDYPKFPLEKKKPGRLMMGILFAIAGTLLCIVVLLIRKWYRENIASDLKHST